jgi:hypothetical protein
MMTLQDISKRYGLTTKQARRWWDAASPLLDHYAQRGPHNVILLSEQALPIFDRLAELIKAGLSLPAAAEKLREELTDREPAEGKLEGNGGRIDARDELIAILKAQLEVKDRQIAALLAQLEELQRRALPPPPRRRWWWPWSGRG